VLDDGRLDALLDGPRTINEALYALQAEEATALRGYMRVLGDELREESASAIIRMRALVDDLSTHHAVNQKLAAQRRTADHQILEAIAALVTIAKSLESLARQADSMPDRVQTVLNSADVTEIHKKLAEALELDIWARLITHSDDEARRFADIASRIEKNVHAAVQNLRDANAGKPSLPQIKTEGTVKERLLNRAHRCYICLLRLSGDVHHLAINFAALCVGTGAVCVGLAAVVFLIRQLSHISVGH